MKVHTHIRSWRSRFASLLQGAVAIAVLLCAASVHAAAPLTISSPGSGDTLIANGGTYTIQWNTASKVTSSFHYFLIPQQGTPVLPPPPIGGSSITFLEDFKGYDVGWEPTPIAATSHTGIFSLDRDIPEGRYTLKIYATNGNLLMRPSDAAYVGESAPFTVRREKPSAASISLISPNGGETWVSGKPQILRFKATGMTGLQLALQNLSTGQPCAIATNIKARATAWLIIPVIGTPCIGSATQRIAAGEYRAALYDTNWASTRASAYSAEPFTIAAQSSSNLSATQQLTDLIQMLTEILASLRAAQ